MLASKNGGDPEVISEQKSLAVAEGQIEASRKSPVSEDQGDEGAWGLKNAQGTHQIVFPRLLQNLPELPASPSTPAGVWLSLLTPEHGDSGPGLPVIFEVL